MRISTLMLFVTITASPIACATEVPTASLVIERVNVIDVRDGSVAENMALVLEGDRIRAIGRNGRFRVPDRTPVVDGTGRYAVPGLWDMHVHALGSDERAELFLKLFVAHGVTGFRDMWGNLEVAERLRGDRASGERLVPYFVVAGNLVDGADPVWPRAVVASTPEQGRSVVDSLVAVGAEFIKVYNKLSVETFHAIADQASKAGVPFAGHVPHSVRATDASKDRKSVV